MSTHELARNRCPAVIVGNRAGSWVVGCRKKVDKSSLAHAHCNASRHFARGVLLLVCLPLTAYVAMPGRATLVHSRFALSWWRSFKACMRRELTLFYRNRVVRNLLDWPRK